MERRGFLQIPGPTNVPDRILRSLSKPLINHRGPEFEEIVDRCIKGLKKVFRTDNDILLFPSAGSGGLESVIVNLFSPGDTILAVSMGVFSERMAIIGENHGLNVIRVNKEWGEGVDPEDIKKVLDDDKDHTIKAICLPHNETASGVTNDIEAVSNMLKESNHPGLLIVDAVSSIASTPLETDKWGIDVVVSGTQKGLMLSPGFGIISLSQRAWKLVETSKMPKWYWDYNAAREKLKSNQFPYTPPTSILYGLDESLKILEEEGIENVWDRHNRMAKTLRNAVKAMGLKLLAKEGYESDTVTAILLPEGIKYGDLSEMLRLDYGVVIGGGLQRLSGKIFRIGHLGSIHELDIYAIICALELSLYRLGYKVELGTGAKAVGESFLNS